ncbi:MAG: Uncharacterized protein G01um101470_572 [Parcubacteria group bacterium Gr01-1014_70]|nr:MAG: Uncharacterized protein G01um101470_572 [Parcubacteria group bacterium Gr01-1014_70]
MKISKNLPQFKDENVLLVVTGRQEADFFRAGEGVIENITGFKIEKPLYDDRKGRVVRRGHGQVLASGAVYEDQKEKILQDFRREFRKTLKAALVDFIPDHIYVYVPSYLANEVVALFPKRMALTIKKIVKGNFYGRHAFEILERIRVR